jgi:mannosyltransferase OCH1-like enzyme
VWLPEHPLDLPGDFLVACRERTAALHPQWTKQEHCDASSLADPAFDPVRDALDDAWFRFSHRPTAKSDLMRLAVLYLHGGVYCDHDVFAIRPFDDLLNRGLLLVADRMEPLLIGEHVMGAEPRNPIIWAILTRFIRSRPGDRGQYSPRLTRFVIESGMGDEPLEAMLPAVFCPAPRVVESEDEAYTIYPQTRAMHLWSRWPDGTDFQYDLDRLRSIVAATCLT